MKQHNKKIGILGSIIFALLFFALPASARVETIRWIDTENEPGAVDGYKVYYGLASGTYDTIIDVVIPSVIDDVFQYNLDIAITEDIFVVITAYVNGPEDTYAESLFSNERCKGGCLEPPPPPPPPPPGPEDSDAQIDGFKLWDAEEDTVIISNFDDGAVIDVDVYPCVAIEVLGNAYLSQSGPGSISLTIDPASWTGCDNVGFTHENHSPYAWEVEEGPNRFVCAESLTINGMYTLTITPYSQDSCEGDVGVVKTVTFSVINGEDPAATTSRPGQPVLIEIY